MDKIDLSINRLLEGENLTEEYLQRIPDLSSPDTIKIILDILKEVYNSKMPFNTYLGVRVTDLTLEKAVIEIDSREELQGNYVQKILHGGAISSVIDLAGGIIAQSHAFAGMKGITIAELLARFSKMSTLNIRVDYLRPGAGSRFKCISKVLRAGNKIAVVQMEMLNENEILIASGTGSYLIG
ncbi:MAG TPA: thioesterase family protein [Spirochaetota bacterium]|nr:thioesterase family protein [Spirochaetota bacterium]HPJ36059.1 thioesterase family protein [Spirochaetota bacterium]